MHMLLNFLVIRKCRILCIDVRRAATGKAKKIRLFQGELKITFEGNGFQEHCVIILFLVDRGHGERKSSYARPSERR